MHQQVNSDMWLVVHVPKTAGTSFRWALDKRFGESSVVRDYGRKADATSDVVREHLYSGDQAKNTKTLVTEISRQAKQILIGHFYLPKYARFFAAPNIMAFVRDPLVRMCSEYLHRTKNGTFTGSFSDFVRKPGNRNLQSRFLGGISDESFIGLTEQYRASLRHINHLTQWNLSNRKKNVGKRGGGRKYAENLSTPESALFYRMNPKDAALYRSASRSFDALVPRDSAGQSLFNCIKRNSQA